MYKIKILLLLLYIFASSLLSAQSYTDDAFLVGKGKSTATIRSSGIHEKSKEAIQMAIKSAFNTLFIHGIDGLNDGMPLISKELQAKSSDYLARFFDDKNKRYLSFIAKYEEDKEPVKLPDKTYKVTAILDIYIDALNQDLARNNIKQKTVEQRTVQEIKKEVAQPTIMIVPYKQQNKSYKEILREAKYVDQRNAIAQVQNAFIKNNYEIKEVMAVLEATEKSMLFESNTSAESFDSHLINNSGADVYVTVDVGHNSTNEGTMGSLALVAYEKSSGKILASKQATTNRYQKGTHTDLYRIAADKIIDDLIKDITKNYARKIETGNTIVLRVSVGSNSSTDLDTEVSSKELPLSDVIRIWLRKNALNGRFHVQGSTRDLIIFDEIQAATKSKEGHFTDANDFALDIFTYLRKDLGINCDKRVDGNTIYITIDE